MWDSLVGSTSLFLPGVLTDSRAGQAKEEASSPFPGETQTFPAPQPVFPSPAHGRKQKPWGTPSHPRLVEEPSEAPFSGLSAVASLRLMLKVAVELICI